MRKRLAFLLIVLFALLAVAPAYWAWPDFGRPLPPAALATLPGPIRIVRVQPVREESVRALVESLPPHLAVDLRVADEWVIDERQMLQWDEDLYYAPHLLERLAELAPPGFGLLGVTDQPMYEEGHWWLFGIADAERPALVSTAHLWFDDIEGDTAHPIFRDRLSKVAVHEVAHSLGFMHCPNPRCVMFFSSSLGMLDRGRHTFCKTCLDREYAPIAARP